MKGMQGDSTHGRQMNRKEAVAVIKAAIGAETEDQSHKGRVGMSVIKFIAFLSYSHLSFSPQLALEMQL